MAHLHRINDLKILSLGGAMRRELAESFAASIEQGELRECSERMNHCRILAELSHGQERQQFLRQAEAAGAELRQWSNLVSHVRASAEDAVTECTDVSRAGTRKAAS